VNKWIQNRFTTHWPFTALQLRG